ncbi:MAG TPA: phosphatase PAP2 family protein [Candidatus Cloacimonadota bacterium]|nr:phosphatase PAP2 family protein [Candidatus Cloacimonadota bacterium]
MKQFAFLFLLIIISAELCGQVFEVDRQKYLWSTSAALSAYFLNEYADKKITDQPSLNDLAKLDKAEIPFFDKWAWQPYSQNLDDFSDYSVFLSLGLSAFYVYDDTYWKDNVLVLSQTLISQVAVNKWIKTLARRYRPFAYDDDVSPDKKQTRNCRHSFYSLHSSTTFATATFAYFYYSKLHGKNLSVAAILYSPAVATACLRVFSGNHFLSDVVIGALAGSGISYLICRTYQSSKVSLDFGYNSLQLRYHF